MKIRKILPIAMLLLVAAVAASCLGDNEDVVYTDDTAITSFSLGTLNVIHHTTSSTGEDSTYTSTLDCSDYVFYIDQSTSTVYNPDSLPVGTDASKALVTVGTQNSGYAYLKSLKSDSVTYISSSDSLDFSEPRTVIVYSNSGLQQRSYSVHVNVHQEVADSFHWTQTATVELFKQMTGMKAVATQDQVTVFGCVGGTTVAVASTDGGTTWRQCTFSFNHTLAADAYQGVVVKDNYMYLIDGNSIIRSKDASTWETVATTTQLKQLVAASSARFYAYATDGRLMASADGCQTWTACTLDDELSLLPTESLSYVCTSLRTNSGAERLLLLGNRNAQTYASDTHAIVWGKIDETDASAQEQPWSYFDVNSQNRRAIPRLGNLQATAYDDGVAIIGGASLGGKTRNAFDSVYVSRDAGITWIGDTTLCAPADFVAAIDSTATAPVFGFTSDSNNFLWIISGTDGKVWKGRINRLGWCKEQTSFTE